LFLVLVLIGDLTSAQGSLRGLQEAVVDRPAFHLWWWVQGRFPHEIGELIYPLGFMGIEALGNLLWFIWFSVVGGLPYLVLGYALGLFRDRREKPQPVAA
jgi:hypothetical protein